MRNIDVAAELGRLGIEFKAKGRDELRIRCPYHEDNSPSCDISLRKLEFVCRSCQVSGDIFALFVKLTGQPRHIVVSKFSAASDKPVEASVVERYHSQIWTATKLLEALHGKGISDGTIKRFLLGEHEGRVTIPIANPFGMYVNLRKYLPNAKDVPKTINLKGRGTPPRLYPFSQLQYDQLVLCGGEIKALAALQRLNDHGIGALCLTTGENEWVVAYEEFFRGKRVWVAQDIDAVGRKSAEYRCARLYQVCDWVGNVEFPLDIAKFPTGDLNDYIMQEGADLLQLLEDCPKWIGKLASLNKVEDQKPLTISIKEALSAEMVHKRFQSKVSITAVGTDCYFIPKDVLPQCPRNQDFCDKCPVYHKPPETVFKVPNESTAIVSMMDSHDKFLGDEIRNALLIPTCPAVTFEIQTRYKIYETRAQRALNLTEQDSDKTAVPAVLVDQETELNETYEVTGKSVPHPKNQRCIAIVSKADAIADALTGFRLTSPEELHLFRPDEWTVEAIDAKLDRFYEELEANVTEIYERRSLHVLVDLVYHSVLAMRVAGHVEKGVAEMLAVGDSAQGKSVTTMRIADFYGLGERVDCKNATVAGLLGGLEQIGGKWFVQWGVIPTHDRRLVILEELKGMRSEVFAKLTDMRSSGKAELPKILRRKAQARTRLVALSNSRRNTNLSTYSYGITAIMDLIRSPEDVRRFDAAIILNRNDISKEAMNYRRAKVKPTFTSEQARRLVLWCWTRSVDQVQITDEVLEVAVAEANKMCAMFTDEIPLVDKGSMKFKLLRLAAGLAGRTFSSNDVDYDQLIVRPCHVQWVAKFLTQEYSTPSHGYLEMTQRVRKREELLDTKMILSELSSVPQCQATLEHMLHTDEIDSQDIANWCNWDNDVANLLIGKLVRNNALIRKGRSYTKSAAFAEMLRELVKNPPTRPEFIPEVECKY